MTQQPASRPVDFSGRVIVLGCGSIGQGVLPLLAQHITLEGKGRLLVLSADEAGRSLARACGAEFLHAHLTPGNHTRLLAPPVQAGDLVLNLSVNVSSLDVIRFCASRQALYVDTSIEPWPGIYDNPRSHRSGRHIRGYRILVRSQVPREENRQRRGVRYVRPDRGTQYPPDGHHLRGHKP